jgi:excisionase family DNA binding protein
MAADPDALDALADALAPRLVSSHTTLPPSPYLRPREAAEYLRCSLGRVRNLTSAGRLPVLRDGRRVLYERAALDRYLSSPVQETRER